MIFGIKLLTPCNEGFRRLAFVVALLAVLAGIGWGMWENVQARSAQFEVCTIGYRADRDMCHEADSAIQAVAGNAARRLYATASTVPPASPENHSRCSASSPPWDLWPRTLPLSQCGHWDGWPRASPAPSKAPSQIIFAQMSRRGCRGAARPLPC